MYVLRTAWKILNWFYRRNSISVKKAFQNLSYKLGYLKFFIFSDKGRAKVTEARKSKLSYSEEYGPRGASLVSFT